MKLLSGVVELIGLTLVATGIGIEIAYKADLGWLLITAGSLVVTFGAVAYAKLNR